MKEYKKVILAYNGSSNCKNAMEKAVDLSSKFKIELVIVSVIELTSSINYDFAAMGLYTPVIAGSEFDEKLLEEERYTDIVKEIKEFSSNNNEVVVLFGDPVDEIIKLTQENPDSLLIVSSSEKKEYEKWVLGSVARKLSNAAPSDTLIVRKCEDR
jgi:nucleotide-binding universal stress UspA family protein